jgi:hypothetical protein
MTKQHPRVASAVNLYTYLLKRNGKENGVKANREGKLVVCLTKQINSKM